jgi:hypothetical protein
MEKQAGRVGVFIGNVFNFGLPLAKIPPLPPSNIFHEGASMRTRKIVFEAYNVTEHVYTWDYSKSERAIELYDAGDELFALITLYCYSDDETGAMQDHRSGAHHHCYLYSKKDLTHRETVEAGKHDELLALVKQKPWGDKLRPADELHLDSYRIFIDNGSLVAEDT